MNEQERYDAYMRRKAEQADQQDDVKRGPFPNRLGFICGNCGEAHATREEPRNCREIG